MFLGRNPELIVESVVPDFLHVISIRDDNRAQLGHFDVKTPRMLCASSPT